MKWTSAYTRLVWLALSILVILTIYSMARHGEFVLEKLERFGRIIESGGGKIMLLSIMALIFFIAALGMAYYVMDSIQAGTLKPDDVTANMMIQFVTGSAFGTALGALINLLGGTSKQSDK